MITMTEANNKKSGFFKSFFSRLFPHKIDSKKEKARKIVVLIALIVFIVTGLVLLVNYIIASLDKWGNDNLRDYYNNAAVSNDDLVKRFYEDNPNASHDFAKLLEINPDTIGWIKIGNTGIDYPVFKGEDNSFYLTHNYKKNYSRFGSVFADYRTKIQKDDTSDITILYAHNMESTGEYFEKLTKFSPWESELDYYKKTPIVNYDTLFEKSKWKIFGAVYCTIDSKYGETFNYLDKLDFDNESDFYEYMSEVMDRSMFYTDVDIKYGDKFLLMSTCYFPIDRQVNGRFLLYARKIREDESEEVDTDKAVINPSPLLFDYYYKTHGGKWEGSNWDRSKLVGYDEWLEKSTKDKK